MINSFIINQNVINSHLLNPVVGTTEKVLSEFLPLQEMAATFPGKIQKWQQIGSVFLFL